ncbi:MAG: FCD domain-containing protein [Hyphomicrobiales bacterium]|nr:FCD domain-containing protein [Hyphomicrobiales bacterium]
MTYLGNFIIPRQILNVARGTESERVQYLRKIQAEHVAIYEAIRVQNIAAARTAARRHLPKSLSRYRKASSRAWRHAESARMVEAE